MKLYLTPLSHFARKVRIVIDFYKIECDYIDVGNVAEMGLQKFAGNPLMVVPVLDDGDNWIIESENIISYLLKKYELEDQLKFRTQDVDILNFRSILTGIMLNEVKIIQGKRSGIEIYEYPYFKKAKLSIEESLNWIERRIDKLSWNELNYNSILLVCAIEHIDYFETVSLEKYKNICERVLEVAKNPIVNLTNPFELKPKP